MYAVLDRNVIKYYFIFYAKCSHCAIKVKSPTTIGANYFDFSIAATSFASMGFTSVHTIRAFVPVIIVPRTTAFRTNIFFSTISATFRTCCFHISSATANRTGIIPRITHKAIGFRLDNYKVIFLITVLRPIMASVTFKIFICNPQFCNITVGIVSFKF